MIDKFSLFFACLEQILPKKGVSMDKIRCYLNDILLCLSNAQDLISPDLSNHNQQVAYLSFRLCEQIGLPLQDKKDVFLAALVHDIGALSHNELLTLIENEPDTSNQHAWKGAKLLEGFKPLTSIAPLVKYHHISWKNGDGLTYRGEPVPLYSHIIHLADRFCANIQFPAYNILTQLPNILTKINAKNGSIFVPNFVEAINQLSQKEYVWLDLISRDPIKMLSDSGLSETLTLDINDTIDFAILLSRIIDFRSRFTACHSAGVAKVAEALAQLFAFSPQECKMMLIAGYLHDIGKLSIDNAILEKMGPLTSDEFNQIRTHTYYTYSLLNNIKQFGVIKLWACLHHERLDGNGYPFHLDAENIPLGSRIMAVADVFSALTEDRPYRKGMPLDRVLQILDDMVTSEALDKTVVALLKENLDMINIVSRQSQQDVSVLYQDFLNL
jgi:HD-GYP domain-containing protein (c-di-GMP phosphodiesterase class II)